MEREQQWDTYLPTVSADLPSLSVLDEQSRCRVCKDYLTGPMMTTCGHTFCSICIRRALNADGRCPSCRSLEEESKLRKNLLIEDLIEAYLPLRFALMNFISKRSSEQTRQEEPSWQDDQGSQSDIEVDTSISPAYQQPIRSTRASTRKRGQSMSETPDGFVVCPVCNNPVHSDRIHSHVDQCLLQPETASDAKPSGPSLNSTHSQYFTESGPAATAMTNDISFPRASSTIKSDSRVEQKRLPKPNYAVMNDTKLRKAMIELGISTSGTRATLQKRYTEYIALWNSNLDSKYPKSRKQLQQEIVAWDRIQNKAMHKATNQEIDDAHQKGTFDSNFEDLVTKAKKSLKRKAETKDEDSVKKQTSGENS